MARASNLRRTATQQAQAEYGPQRKRVRRETGSQVRSIRSTVPALTSGLQLASRQLGHAGLSARDLAIARSELADRMADASSSAVLQEQQVRQDARGQFTDLSQSQSQAERSILSQLQQAQAEQAQDLAAEERGDARDFQMDILKEQTLKDLGLGSYADDGGGAAGGLTPTQRRAAAEEHQNAAFWAKQAISAAKTSGGKDLKTGEQVLPPTPAQYSDEDWAHFVEGVAGKVGSVETAQKAVQAVRDHYQPSAASGFDALKQVALAAAPTLAPKPLQSIAQFGSSLLRR